MTTGFSQSLGERWGSGHIDSRIARIVRAIEEGTAGQAIQARLRALEDERETIEPCVHGTPEPPSPEIHPALIQTYRHQVESLEVALNDEAIRSQAAAAIRSLIDKVVIFPEAGRGGSESNSMAPSLRFSLEKTRRERTSRE